MISAIKLLFNSQYPPIGYDKIINMQLPSHKLSRIVAVGVLSLLLVSCSCKHGYHPDGCSSPPTNPKEAAGYAPPCYVWCELDSSIDTYDKCVHEFKDEAKCHKICGSAGCYDRYQCTTCP